jgi:hypothetical protein
LEKKKLETAEATFHENNAEMCTAEKLLLTSEKQEVTAYKTLHISTAFLK